MRYHSFCRETRPLYNGPTTVSRCIGRAPSCLLEALSARPLRGQYTVSPAAASHHPAALWRREGNCFFLFKALSLCEGDYNMRSPKCQALKCKSLSAAHVFREKPSPKGKVAAHRADGRGQKRTQSISALRRNGYTSFDLACAGPPSPKGKAFGRPVIKPGDVSVPGAMLIR